MPKGKFQAAKVQKQIIERKEKAATVVDLSREYTRSTPAVRTIAKDKQTLTSTITSKATPRQLCEVQSQVSDNVERLLLIWINRTLMRGGNITKYTICEKAKQIFNDIVKDIVPSTSAGKQPETFQPSNDWFERFKQRTGIHNLIRPAPAVNVDQKPANDFIRLFKSLVCTELYLPQQMFNCEETCLLWRKLPNRTSNTLQEHQPLKDRLTLLFCANASGDLRLKPLLVYHSDTPRTLISNKVQKTPSDVVWRSNKQVAVTQDIFVDWLKHTFGPSVKTYLMANNLPLHALLVLDNALLHSEHRAELIPQEFNFIRIQYLPPNTAPFLQPLDQQVMGSFKKRYLKELFEHCFNIIEGTCLSLEVFWKHHFHIVTCAKLIGKAWAGVTASTLRSAWKKLWKGVEWMECSDAAATSDTAEPTVHELIALGNRLGLAIDSNDIEELLTEYLEDPSIKECSIDMPKVVNKEPVSAEAVVKSNPQSTEDIRNVLNAWDTVSSYVCKHHPDVAVMRQLNAMYETDAISHFRTMLKRRQKQSKIDHFFKKIN
ncbi:tigger transposable element-derived protein 1-like [Anopheles stephensi]|uniref:tigger transposable element-derived protein 1-like n=1 Tax=Anopheles stephensi TaxID=30069 RepID=UPI0016589109|nr:tigger transposable element-derived protein 1-like [Anopheles stephensi]